MIENLSYLTLQIHDELVFEIPTEKVENLSHRIKNIMESITDIPLKIDIQIRGGLGNLSNAL